MNDNNVKKVFISYAWADELHQRKVEALARRLVDIGIDVIYDQWDLKPGQDLYQFMEQCVADDSIDKVLIICNKTYAEKADARIGGVGSETQIISPEVYVSKEQQKFIPLLFEKNENGEPYVPVYLKSRLYIDLTDDNFELGFIELARNICDKPLKMKPPLGKKPKWLEEEPTKIDLLDNKIEMNLINPKQARMSKEEFLLQYVDLLKHSYKLSYSNPKEYLDDFKAIKANRDLCLKYLLNQYTNIENYGNYIADVIEYLYNELCNVKAFNPDRNSCYDTDLEIFRVHIWELFICLVTFIRKKSDNVALHNLLVHTYFLKKGLLSSNIEPCSYVQFRIHAGQFETLVKPTIEEYKSHFTLVGHYIKTERGYLPYFSGDDLANTDVFLYQIHDGLNLGNLEKYSCYWFPTCYIYSDDNKDYWKKLISNTFCEALYPLFEAADITNFKNKISKCTTDSEMRYSGSWHYPKNVDEIIKIEDIGTTP